MQPAARYSAAIEVLDVIRSGQPPEKALTHWARGHRFAGSKDRAAIRDIVFDVLRNRRSAEVAGGGHDGRSVVLGLLRLSDIPVTSVFGAGGHAPAMLTPAEEIAGGVPTGEDKLNLPSELIPMWRSDLGSKAETTALALQQRAPITLRITSGRVTVAQAIAALADDEIVAEPDDQVPTALRVVKNERRLRNSSAYEQGLVDLQDASSQRAVAALSLTGKDRVLDYCAGGGGKALAIADMHLCQVTAHDINPARTADIIPRARRAGLTVDVVSTEALASMEGFDLVFCDAPCSGSGTWRRNPQEKWDFSLEKLFSYNRLQADAIAGAVACLRPGGTLVYATCSVFSVENEGAIADLVASGRFSLDQSELLLPDARGDGFYWAHLTQIQ